MVHVPAWYPGICSAVMVITGTSLSSDQSTSACITHTYHQHRVSRVYSQVFSGDCRHTGLRMVFALSRDFFARPALAVAPDLIGAFLRVTSAEGTVVLRITETEAYHGVGTPGPYDAGSHSKDRRTPRNA